jgi:acyl-CoA hydrolase
VPGTGCRTVHQRTVSRRSCSSHTGDLVEVAAQLVLTGRASMHILVTVRAGPVLTGRSEQTTSCLVVFVAVDEARRPTPVRPWEPARRPTAVRRGGRGGARRDAPGHRAGDGRGADLALYPGSGAAPGVLGFRMSTSGFKELADVSHLGPARATLAALKEAEPDGVWQADARRLLAAVCRARGANSPRLWREVISVEVYAGRETAIAAMTDYAPAVTANYLERIIADPGHLSFTTLLAEYLNDGDRQDLRVSFNRIMIATFYLVGLPATDAQADTSPFPR